MAFPFSNNNVALTNLCCPMMFAFRAHFNCRIKWCLNDNFQQKKKDVRLLPSSAPAQTQHPSVHCLNCWCIVESTSRMALVYIFGVVHTIAKHWCNILYSPKFLPRKRGWEIFLKWRWNWPNGYCLIHICKMIRWGLL